MKPRSNQVLESKIREFFLEKYNIKLSKEDYLEVCNSLTHLGKAICLSLKDNK